jgi:hypothetical protein
MGRKITALLLSGIYRSIMVPDSLAPLDAVTHGFAVTGGKRRVAA